MNARDNYFYLTDIKGHVLYHKIFFENVLHSIYSRLLMYQFLLLMVPEIHRFLTCLYFIIFRHYNNWNSLEIGVFSLMEGIEAGLLALGSQFLSNRQKSRHIFHIIENPSLGIFVLDFAQHFPTAQLSYFGFLTILPIDAVF